MLELKNIYKTFNPGTINEKVALNGLNLTLNEGDFVTVIGGNGAGKSTMLNAVAGTWMVDEGQILIDGIDVTKLSEHKRATYLGRVFQDPMTGTAATMGIEENLALAKRRGKTRLLKPGITKAERQEYKELLKILGLGLEDRLTSKVGLLSGGQRQALTLLMATLQKPKLLLLDEHTAALDPKTAAKVLEITEMIVNRDHLTTMMITHNMQDAIIHGNRLIMMMEGRIILDIQGEEKKKLTVKVNGSDLQIPFKTIIHADHFSHMIHIHTTKEKELVIRQSFGAFTAPLKEDSRFFICNRGTIINMEHAVDFDGTMFLLDDGSKIVVSRELCKPARQHFMDYLFQKGGF